MGDAPPTKIFVGKLTDRVTSENLRPLFEEFGVVKECDVLTSYGFVHMSTRDEAEAAISALDGRDFMGSKLSVEKSTGKSKGSGNYGRYTGPRGGGGGGPMRGRGRGGRGGPYSDRGGYGGGSRYGGGNGNGYGGSYRNGYGSDRGRAPPPEPYSRGGYDDHYGYPPRDDPYRRAPPPPPMMRDDPYSRRAPPPHEDSYGRGGDRYPPSDYPPASRPAPRDPYASSDYPSYSSQGPPAGGRDYGASMYSRRSPPPPASKPYAADPYAPKNNGYMNNRAAPPRY